MVHDAQLDYYGRRLATCSSDKTIKVFDVVADHHVHLADLRGHEGPVWQVAWGHPKFGSLLASCSFDHRVILWKETSNNQWSQVCPCWYAVRCTCARSVDIASVARAHGQNPKNASS